MAVVYFVSGANRGIGYAFVEELAKRPDVKIIATTRNVENSTELVQLKEKTKNIEIVKLDVSSEESIDTLDAQLKEIAAEGIDVFISNAGISQASYRVINAPRDVWLRHYKTNTLGPVLIFQVLYPYLLKKQTRKIVFVSSLAGSLGQYLPFPTSAYGQSKAALNYSAKEISSELAPEGFTVIATQPGAVTSDMGIANQKIIPDPNVRAALAKMSITPAVSAVKQLELIDNLTKESNGKFLNFDGSELLF
ncbi:uncharacterized oxidoreductase [[Candida] railenensis]|uniref:Uncharacterized oxidoreductase n=1 Tax=[Candida] railenensis TaxID=45579 RepID=A0A9P0QKZ0_9ASCO|nr:uncharacterized oxidoreductase [[Candida] railenensis]